MGDTRPSLPVSVVVPSRNRPGLLTACVESVLDGDSLPREIVVVDQSESPHPRFAAPDAFSPCRGQYIFSHAPGVSRARNLGIRAAHCRLVACVDDDVLVSRTWLRSLTQALLQGGPATVVTGRVVSGPPERGGAYAASLQLAESTIRYRGPIDADVLYTGNMALYTATLQDIGGFDERLGPGTALPAAEDNDFGLRLLRAHYDIVYVPEAEVTHRAWRTDLVRTRWAYGRGQGAFYAKHLRAEPRRIARRAVHDAIERLARAFRRFPLEPRVLLAALAYVAGLPIGGVQYWLETTRQE